MSTQGKNYTILASTSFVRLFSNLSDKPPVKHPQEIPDRMKLANFIQTYLEYGWDPNFLKGKNISSDNVPTQDPQWYQKVRYAQEHDLHHYHIGIPYYVDSGKGYLTSEYVLHYKKISDTEIKLVDMDYHPPLELPKQEYMSGNVDLSPTNDDEES